MHGWCVQHVNWERNNDARLLARNVVKILCDIVNMEIILIGYNEFLLKYLKE